MPITTSTVGSVALTTAFTPCNSPLVIPVFISHRRRPAQSHQHGAHTCLLRSLRPSSLPPPSTVKMALINIRSLNNKTFILKNFFSAHTLDFLLLTETWQKPGDVSAFSELLPPSCSFFSCPRATGRGGGVASVFKNKFKCRLITTNTYSSFELQVFVLDNNCSILCAIIYRPPKANQNFISEISEFLAEFLPKFDKILICGDFNIHVCCSANQLGNDFRDLLDSFDLTQLVAGPTHNLGHTLDLIITYGLSVSVKEISVTPLSDHLPILFDLRVPSPATKPVLPPCRRRIITSSTASDFASAFQNSDPTTLDNLCYPASPDCFISSFHSTCTSILDSVAPLRIKSSKSRADPWLNDYTRALRQDCRLAERKWKKHKSPILLGIWRDKLATFQRAMRDAKALYLSRLISTSSNRPRVLFSTINSVINPSTSSPLDASTATCEEFLKFFVDKIVSVRGKITANTNVADNRLNSASVHPTVVLNNFEPVSLSLLSEIVQKLKATTCPSDIVPAKVLKEVFNTVGPYLLVFINMCLSSGTVPDLFKHAVVRPLLKKPHLDPSVLSNFRPVSHLSFLSKVLEKVVFIQLQSFLEKNAIFEKFQSGFRSRHSTESALLKIHNDILLSADNKTPMILVLLDLTAAFDTVDHSILISRLSNHVGIQGPVLKWFSSYLKTRSFSVMIGDLSSSCAPLSCGVPQGSILGPLLFTLYLLPLGKIISTHNLHFHCYADDIQVYLPIIPNAPAALKSLLNCLEDINLWLTKNFLHLNQSKMECIVFGTSNVCENVISNCVSSSVASLFKPAVRNLGVILDPGLCFDQQIDSVVKLSFFQLRLLSKVKPFLSRNDLEMAIHAFISSRLDYCNSLYFGIKQSSLSRLQLVQNVAARLLTNTSRYSHITPVLCSLHWLPVKFRITFKLLLFVFKAIHGLAPEYLSDCLKLRRHCRALRSSKQPLLEVPFSNCKQWGDRTFSIAGPKLWNSLPPELYFIDDLALFKARLKTHLFKLAFNID